MHATGMDRLTRAMSIWLDNRSATQPLPAAELMALHPDLGDLLEPLFEHGHGDASADAASVTLDDFRLVREIGRGGMGIVYEAQQLSLDRRVAMKLLPESSGLPVLLSARSIARFRREAMTVARLEHPGIVKVFAVGTGDRGHWFAMEFIDGVTLDEYARRCRREDPDTAVRSILIAGAAVAEALAHAHAAGVIHRDIKPSNVLVRADGRPVLTDFGVARETSLPSMTQTGELAGTPFYVSPEQAAGREVDPRSDVFSLGVTLYELLTQRRPFDGDSSHAVLDQIVRHEPPSPDRVDAELPRDVAAIVVKALEKDPARRYATAAAMAQDLQRFLAHRPVLAQPVSALGRVRRWLRREPLQAAFAAVLLVAAPAVLGLLSYVWWTGRATDIGRDALRTTRVEEILLDAVLSRVTPEGSRKGALLPSVLELAPNDPYVLVSLAIYYSKQANFGPQPALQFLLARPAGNDNPGVRRLIASLRRRIEDPERRGIDFAELEQVPRSALDAYVLAELSLEGLAVAMRTGDEARRRECGERAAQFARRAISLTEQPRSQYFLVLNRAARCVGDGAAVLQAVDAMTEHWPDSAGAWVFRAMGWQDFEPESEIAEQAARRSLELSPDNMLGLEVLAAVAARRGDTGTAHGLESRVEQLYPHELAWRRRAAAGAHK